MNTLSADDVCKIIKAARDASLVHMKYNGLELTLGPIPETPQEIKDNRARRAEDLQTLSVAAKVAQAEELKLLDPVAYEALIEQSLIGESEPMPELNVPLDEANV